MFRELLGNTAWSLVAAAVARTATLVAHVLTIRWLGSEDYGAVALVQTTVLTTAAAIGLGLGAAATKIVSRGLAQGSTNLVREVGTLTYWVIALAATCGGLQFAARNSIAMLISPDASGLADALAPGSALLIFTAISLFQIGVLSGFRAFRNAAICNLVSALLTVAFTILGVLYGPLGIVGALAAGQGVACALQHLAVLKCLREHRVTQRNSLPTMARSSLLAMVTPIVLLQAVTAPADLFCLSLLSRTPGGPAEVGVFCAAALWTHLLRFFPLALATACLPQVVHAANTGDRPAYRKLTLGILGIGLIASAPGAVLIIVFDTQLLAWFGGSLASREVLLGIVSATGVAVSLQLITEKILLGSQTAWLPLGFAIARCGAFCGLAMASPSLDAERLSLIRLAVYFSHAILAVAIVLYLRPSREEISAGTNSVQCESNFRGRTAA